MYIPKNRIVTNLYTNNNNFVYKDSKTPFIGYYYKTFEGKFFAGKTPNDGTNEEIIQIQNQETLTNSKNPHNNLTSQIAFTDSPLPFSGENEKLYNSELIFNYSKIKKIDLNNKLIKNIPALYYPEPNESDYKLGSFTRYFVTKVNEILFIEIDKETYDSIYNHNINWVWELYTPFYFQWTLKGEESFVYNTNKNITLLTEKRLNKKGLTKYLKEDYLKFYK